MTQLVCSQKDTNGAKENGNEARIHVAISNDGTRIAGRVEGHGPALVLVHGGLGDGEVSWRFMLPFLADHFTCYQMSTRGRGLSADNVDHSRERQFEDIAAFVKSIGEPVGLFGHSMGAVWVLGGAALSAEHVRRVALYEPDLSVAKPRWSDDQIAQLTEAISENRTADAVRLAVELIGLNDDEQALFSVSPGLEIAEANIGVGSKEAPELNRPLDDVVVEKLTMPVLLIQGTLSGVHFKDSVRHLAERIDHARVVEIAGAGHIGPLTAGESVARELMRFFNA